MSALVVHSPDDVAAEDVAALLAVLASLPRLEPTAPRTRERWGDPAGRLRRPLSPGPGAWTSAPGWV